MITAFGSTVSNKNECFRTFWHGPRLTWTSQFCLSSFILRGHRVEMYSYAPVEGVPSGVVLRDAGEILPTEQVFLYRGGHAERSAPSLHSNLFRYKLLRDHGGWWVDTDVLLLDGEIPDRTSVFGIEDPVGENGRPRFGTAILKFPAGSDIMERAYAETAAVVDTNPAWGITGPGLFTKLAVECGLGDQALPPSMLYAVHWTEAFKFVRPKYREEVERSTAGAAFAHLFHHALKGFAAVDKQPPKGSFLASQMIALEKLGPVTNCATKKRDTIGLYRSLLMFRGVQK